ncbi:MAG: hypothetical protein ACYTG0_03590 [Planctomycetota bacterium]
MQADISEYAAKPERYPTSLTSRRDLPVRRRTIAPDHILRFYLPLAVVEVTNHVMRQFGDQQRECYVWWGGYFTPEGAAQVVSAYCPSIHTDYGRIELDMSDFHALHHELRTRDQVLLIELHTHPPGAGGQNEIDAAHPAAPYRGYVSVVVPDFAYPCFRDLRHCYVYEYVGVNRWLRLDKHEIEQKFTIEDSLVLVRQK